MVSVEFEVDVVLILVSESRTVDVGENCTGNCINAF